jgi:hypothetical protein
MSSKTPRRIIWGVCWLIVLGASYLAFQKADRSFIAYLSSFNTSQRNLGELLPPNVTFFVCDQDFQKDWSQFRTSDFYSNIRNISSVRDFLSSWNLNEKELAPWEKWILQSWGSGTVLSYSEENQSFYLISPIGNREQCFEWLRRAISGLRQQHVPWKPKQIANRLCIESESSSFWPEQMKVQFYAVHGMGILAIGKKTDPIQAIYEAANAPQSTLFREPDFPQFYEEGVAKGNIQGQQNIFGFIRQKDPTAHDLGKTWDLVLNEGGKVEFELNLPSEDQPLLVHPSIFSSLLKIQQSDDILSITSSWEKTKKLWAQGVNYLPESFRQNLFPSDFSSLLGNYAEFWQPLLKETGDEFFVSFGEAGIISDKFRIPFPRTILALPFTDKAGFFHALEQTISKSNEELFSNLLIRKNVRDFGEYYEVKMTESLWREQHGLKELPVFSFVDGLIIFASDESSMEHMLKSLHSDSAKEASESENEEFELKINMKEAPGILRILFGAFGLLNPQGDNVFLSPSAMSTLSEAFSIMQNFQDGEVKLLQKAHQTQFKLLFHRAQSSSDKSN